MKKEQGITLIALIVTIIVLLILAGVSISALVGDNGILAQTTKAAETTKYETAKEEVSLAWANCEIEYKKALAKGGSIKKSDYFSEEKLAQKLEGTGEIVSYEYNENGDSILTYKSKNNTYSFKIDESGNVSENKIDESGNEIGESGNENGNKIDESGKENENKSISLSLKNVELKTSNSTGTTLVVTKEGLDDDVEWEILDGSEILDISEETKSDSTSTLRIKSKGTAGVVNLKVICGDYSEVCTITVTAPSPYIESNANGDVIYYSDIGEEGVALTSENVGNYLGMKVSYNTTDDSATYRLFYIDFNDDYGYGNGTIYLMKSDDLENSMLPTDKDDYNEENFKKFNKAYNPTDTTTDENKAVSWLLNPSNWEEYLDSDKKASYVIGGPSLEMWVESYDQFINAHNGLYTANSEAALEFTYRILKNESCNGYCISLKNPGEKNNYVFYTNNNDLINKDSNSGQTSQVKAQIGMYNPGANQSYWIASPSAFDDDGGEYVVMCVIGNYNVVAGDPFDADGGCGLAVVPVIKPGAKIELICE